jgi:hypothetical protein
VSDEQQLLFQTDPSRFWEIVTNDDSEARSAALNTLDDLLLCEVVRYGFYNREEMIPPLAKFYRGPAMTMPEERRFTTCCREVIIEGQEQLPLQQECSAG